MGDVTEFRSAIRLSISQIATEFGMSRNTVTRRIDQLGIKPDGRRGGYPVYRLKDVVTITAQTVAPTSARDFDPSDLPPMERRAWYQSENERLKVEGEQGRLIPAAEVEAEMALMAKTVVRELETLADRLERDMRVGPDVIDYLLTKIEAMRLTLTEQVIDAEVQDVRVSG